jgi:gluconate 2-dehydrogenase gamma chain
MSLRRRDLLAGTALFVLSGVAARAAVLHGALPWEPNAGDPPPVVKPGPWHFFNGDEGRAVEAIADRIIPPDPKTPGGKDAGCAVYLDRQLAGPYGHNAGHYNRPPFMKAAKNFGPQSESDIAKTYRDGLAALDRYCTAKKGGKHFAELSDGDKDELLKGLESGKTKLEGADGKAFFEQALKDIQQGFFADPIYGGNRDMVAWKMIGFPGARYNYLDWIDRHNERFPLPPVAITGRADWTAKAR